MQICRQQYRPFKVAVKLYTWKSSSGATLNKASNNYFFEVQKTWMLWAASVEDLSKKQSRSSALASRSGDFDPAFFGAFPAGMVTCNNCWGRVVRLRLWPWNLLHINRLWFHFFCFNYAIEFGWNYLHEETVRFLTHKTVIRLTLCSTFNPQNHYTKI